MEGWNRMTSLAIAFKRALGRDDGQGLAEYALILALIAIVAIVALIFLGSQVSTILSTVGSSV
jgi:pilus assembly protein Flp/PilA